MAHDLLTRESPEIIRFFQDIGHITELLRSEPDRYRPVLNGDRYITEAELSESLKITRRTLVEHRTTVGGIEPFPYLCTVKKMTAIKIEIIEIRNMANSMVLILTI